VMFQSYEDNYRSGITLAMRHTRFGLCCR